MDIDLYSLKVFRTVLEEKSFSKSAKILGITQPSVSMQIARLEEKLGSDLFDRTHHNLKPTRLAIELLNFSNSVDELVHSFKTNILKDKDELTGKIKYAMPESCQWTSHYKKIMAMIASFQDLTFEIKIQTNDEIIKLIHENEIDFGFIIGEKTFQNIRYLKFSEEYYTLVAKDKHSFDFENDKFNKKIIVYPGSENYISQYMKTNNIKNYKKYLETPFLSIGTLAGAIHAVTEGAGLGVFPSQCVEEYIKNGKLHEFQNQKKTYSPVYLAKKLGIKQTKRVETIIDKMLEAKPI